MSEVRVLGSFTPTRWDSDVITTEFARLPFLPSCCRSERVSIRIPMGIVPHPDNLEWHQDGGGLAGTTRHMVVWSSEQSTELKTSTGMIIKPKAHAVIWFDNDRAFHRQPTGTDETQRWFVSIRCSGVALSTTIEPALVTLPNVSHPEDIIQKPFDGGFYRIIATPDDNGGMTTTEIQVCEDCWKDLPRYVDFPRGLVSPESDGDRSGNGAKTRTKAIKDGLEGIEHVSKVVCRECYLAAFARMYPGAKPPQLGMEILRLEQTVPPPVTECEYVDEPKAL